MDVFKAEGISVTFPNGTEALRNASIDIGPGEVHGLVGANGAGKSTLIKVISADIMPSAGSMFWDGEPVDWSSPREARSAGIATIYQNVPLVLTLTVIENVFLGESGWQRQPAELKQRYEQLCEQLDYRPPPRARVGDLSIGDRQMVSVLQALAVGARLVIMDEPTASLGESERQIVFAAIERLKSTSGTAFLYVSHFLEEVLQLSDNITVLRDGEVVDAGPRESFDVERLVDGMVGEKFTLEHSDAGPSLATGERLLDVEQLSSPTGISDVSLSVRSGEIVGIAGLLGSGRSELLHAIYGADPHADGVVKLGGVPMAKGTANRVRAGMALVPEDRNTQGLISAAEIWRNASLSDFGNLAWRGIMSDPVEEHERGRRTIQELSVAAPNENTLVSELSGGNAQKILFGRWIFGDSTVFLLDEPTAGIDVGAKEDVFHTIRNLAHRGNGVVVVLSEFEELLAIATRIVVMVRGRIVGEVNPETVDERQLHVLASGVEKGDENAA